MRRIRLDRPVSPGATLARDIVGRAGEVLARAGHPVSSRTFDVLRGRGVIWCYIHDRWGEGIDATPLDSGGATVRPLLRDFSRQIGILVAPFLTLSTPRALETLRSARPTAPLARSRFAADFPSMARVFIEDCAKAEAQAGYLVDRGAGGDLDGHAIGVAAVTSRLAGLVGMDARERVRAVCAALVHDVGMIFVPRHVLAIPHAQRSIPERIRYEDHTVLGEAMLEPFAGPSMHMAIVAGEHHEAADGTGYPHRREGGHRVLRTAEDQRALDRITLMSEVIAVADTYERIISPGAGHEGISPAAARPLMEELAGRTLNREIVQRFLASFPALPLGTEVGITAGPHLGMTGIVSAVRAEGGDPPTVRLFLDAAGRPLDEPIEVVMRAPEVLIEITDHHAPHAVTPGRNRRVRSVQ